MANLTTGQPNLSPYSAASQPQLHADDVYLPMLQVKKMHVSLTVRHTLVQRRRKVPPGQEDAGAACPGLHHPDCQPQP